MKTALVSERAALARQVHADTIHCATAACIGVLDEAGTTSPSTSRWCRTGPGTPDVAEVDARQRQQVDVDHCDHRDAGWHCQEGEVEQRAAVERAAPQLLGHHDHVGDACRDPAAVWRSLCRSTQRSAVMRSYATSP